MKNSPHLRCLSNHARRALILHNMFYIDFLNGYFVARETDSFRNPTYMSACSVLHRSDFMMKCARANERLEPNGNLTKLMLFVLIFSSSYSMLYLLFSCVCLFQISSRKFFCLFYYTYLIFIQLLMIKGLLINVNLFILLLQFPFCRMSDKNKLTLHT
jgi:hypothetical protein